MDESAWIFRGESNAKWNLTHLAWRSHRLIHPQALRANGTTNHTWHASEAHTPADIFLAELRTINAFYGHASRGGAPVPEDTSQTQEIIDQWIKWLKPQKSPPEGNWLNGEFIWPPIELKSLFAIAQHHRTPTQLLDWSRNPFKAAFFCLEEFVRKDCSPKNHERRLAVWALKMFEAKRAENIREMVRGLGDSKRVFGSPTDPDYSDLRRPVGASRFRVIEVPTAPNANLRAQEGVFLAKRFINPDGKSPFKLHYGKPDLDWFDKAFEELRRLDEWRELPPVYKFTLPLTKAPDLLTLLRHAGVSSATLYPGFEGAKWAYDEDLWLMKASGHTIRP